MRLSRKCKYFNPRSHKGSDLRELHNPSNLDNFNPRSHKGSDGIIMVNYVIVRISIHAPTRGATEQTIDQYLATAISIHAPTRGATINGKILCSHTVFQSTLPQGERHQHPKFPKAICKFQSTLPQGERHRNPVIFPGRSYFNPRSHKGSDVRPLAPGG